MKIDREVLRADRGSPSSLEASERRHRPRHVAQQGVFPISVGAVECEVPVCERVLEQIPVPDVDKQNRDEDRAQVRNAPAPLHPGKPRGGQHSQTQRDHKPALNWLAHLVHPRQ